MAPSYPPSHTHQRPPAVPIETISLRYPQREVVTEALSIFARNPIGLTPNPSFWREAGALSAGVCKADILNACVRAGLLLPPGDLFGAPHGYLPGPAAFACDLSHPPIPELTERPSREEITYNARTRLLSQFTILLTDGGPKPSVKRISDFLNLPPGGCGSFIRTLSNEGLITTTDARILPTQKLEILLGQSDLVSRATDIAKKFDQPYRRTHITKREESERIFHAIKGPLQGLVARHPGQTAHELFSIAQAGEEWLPTDTTKPVFMRWLEKLTESSTITVQRRRQGPVRVLQLYFANSTMGDAPPADGAPPR